MASGSRYAGGARRGFTLLELIVAIAIAALVLGVSAPAMQRYYQSSVYRGALSDVVGVLSSARYTAIHSGVDVDVLIDPQERTLQLGEKRTELSQSLSLEVLGAAELNREGVGVIRFYPDGGSSGGYVRVNHRDGQSGQVVVDWLLGKVSVCQQDCAP